MTATLDGARVLITGAAGDIGAAIARRCAEQGARLWLVDRCESVVPLAGELGADAAVVEVGPRGVAAAAVADGATALGGLDGLVQAVGIQAPRRPAVDLEPDVWQRLVEVNLSATLEAAQAAAPRMTSGAIVNIGSISGSRAIPGIVPYGALKAAVHQLSRGLAVELAPDIRVNVVAPGYVDTAMTAALMQDTSRRTALEQRLPAGRIGLPADIAPAVAFLLSPDAAYLTGEVVHVDGGFHV